MRTLLVRARTMWRSFAGRFSPRRKAISHIVWDNRILLLPILVLSLVFLGPSLAPKSPFQTSSDALVSPSAEHLLGTDMLGRDVMSRVLAGGRTLTAMALTASLNAVVIGSVIGMVSGYKSGAIDTVLMRLVDLLLALPPMLVILVFATSIAGNNFLLVMLTAVLLSPGAARIIRGLTQEIVSQEFVSAAEAAGERTLSILVREVLPNLRGRLAVEVALRSGFAVLLIASLNFLGFGVSPPSPDWGLNVFDQRPVLAVAPWAVLAPAMGIFLTVSAVQTIANWIEKKWA